MYTYMCIYIYVYIYMYTYISFCLSLLLYPPLSLTHSLSRYDRGNKDYYGKLFDRELLLGLLLCRLYT